MEANCNGSRCTQFDLVTEFRDRAPRDRRVLVSFVDIHESRQHKSLVSDTRAPKIDLRWNALLCVTSKVRERVEPSLEEWWLLTGQIFLAGSGAGTILGAFAYRTISVATQSKFTVPRSRLTHFSSARC